MAGERKLQILQALAEMLQEPVVEKVTTASLAARLDLSEAALYRHFASKAQMFEGLIEFIEQSIFGLINRIVGNDDNVMLQLEAVIALLLGFAEKNPGMVRVLIGEALVNENERLHTRINQLLARVEATLRQLLRIAEAQQESKVDAELGASLLLCVVVGRWQLFAKSGFKRLPTAEMNEQWSVLRQVFKC